MEYIDQIPGRRLLESHDMTGRVSAAEGVLVRELAGEAVLLDLKRETYFGLDPVGTRMWQALTTAETIQSAFEMLLSEYEVEPDVLRRDLEALIAMLRGEGLIEVSGG
jgi:hypothetical protein